MGQPDEKRLRKQQQRKKSEELAEVNISDNGQIENLKDVEISDDDKKDKYWIKAGVKVKHIDYPNLVMRVVRILRQNKKIRIGNEQKDKMFILGVECNWVDSDGKYQVGKFGTRQLLEVKE